ncbi:DNA polymerase III subunit gamma/tau [Shewanella sp. AS16]|uniref:DNA polymerase III subunit gamma/tau n=1 Tax=Shewanella sp. AS16 TaxID=2907625 RepID=UPI001F19B5F4|nr:DNA polymerase III subunit gamma/tau [Shewanella sp. AS16]MCE9684907.1 DNA polymerase III subunit gamma/tau [Shewanella sp. AS16]
MSYQVLARKWRPAKFEQMVGQSHVLQALTNALSQQRLHHAYLFTGTRGVGKTSLARLFAKGLNCDLGVTASPCGLCASCVEIAEGRFVDLIEVDAASRTKVDDTRELLDNVQYRPTRGRFKVYLIDEVHMLSRSSFNALLKTLEEPPEHVKFLLATTDPQKLPVTVLSRCLQFNLKSLSQSEICAQLTHVLTQEQLSFEPQALTLLAKAANGSMRDALSLTDQAIAFGGGKVLLTQVQTMLGSIDEQQVLALLQALTSGDIANLMQTTAQVLAYGADADQVLRSLLELLHQITLTQFASAAAQQSRYSPQITAFAEQLSAEQVQLYYQILLTGRKDLPHAPDPKSGLEMALLRAVAFVPEKPVQRWTVDAKASVSLPEVKPAAPQTGEQAGEQTGEQTGPTAQAQASPEVVPRVTPGQQAVADEDEDEAPDSALLAEQSLILSQAQSQGFAPQPEPQLESKPQSEPAAVAADAGQAAAPTEAETGLLPETPIESQTESQTESQIETGAAPETVSSSVSAPVQPAAPGALEEAPYADYPQAMAAQADPDDGGYYPGDAAYAMDYSDNLAAPEQSYDESYAQHYAQSHDQTAGQGGEAAAEASLFDDDILDAVLAARNSLLSDIDALAAKDGEAKKPQLAPKLAPQPRGQQAADKPEPVAQELVQVPEQESEQVPEQEPVQMPAQVPAKAERDTGVAPGMEPRATAAADDDRPPWEAPAEAESRAPEPAAAAAPEPEAEPEPEALTMASTMTPAVAPTKAQTVAPAMAPTRALAAPSTAISGHPLDLHWYKLMASLEIGGRVRQLAVNSVCQRLESPLPLLLKPDQKHLAADIAIEQLQQALSQALGEPQQVTILVGQDGERETPLELRKRFHRELLQEAQAALLGDDKIQWLMTKLGAQLDPDSLSYPPEHLSQRSQAIASLTHDRVPAAS